MVDNEYQGRRILVLGSLMNGDTDHQRPLVVDLHYNNECEEVKNRLKEMGWDGREDQLNTTEVAGWFRSRAYGTDEESEGFPSTWAPAASSSFAFVSIGGDTGERVATSPDVGLESNDYEWYDFENTPIDGSVYRISCTRTLWAFTRRSEEQWVTTIVPEVSWARTDDGKSFDSLIEGAKIALSIQQ